MAGSRVAPSPSDLSTVLGHVGLECPLIGLAYLTPAGAVLFIIDTEACNRSVPPGSLTLWQWVGDADTN